MTPQQKIKNIIAKANKLIEQNHKLLAKNKALEDEMKTLRQSVEDGVKKADELHNQIKIIKLARNIGAEKADGTDITELKRKINEYIKEIDHCVAMLND
jgi:hypothetical protein